MIDLIKFYDKVLDKSKEPLDRFAILRIIERCQESNYLRNLKCNCQSSEKK